MMVFLPLCYSLQIYNFSSFLVQHCANLKLSMSELLRTLQFSFIYVAGCYYTVAEWGSVKTTLIISGQVFYLLNTDIFINVPLYGVLFTSMYSNVVTFLPVSRLMACFFLPKPQSSLLEWCNFIKGTVQQDFLPPIFSLMDSSRAIYSVFKDFSNLASNSVRYSRFFIDSPL